MLGHVLELKLALVCARACTTVCLGRETWSENSLNQALSLSLCQDLRSVPSRLGPVLTRRSEKPAPALTFPVPVQGLDLDPENQPSTQRPAWPFSGWRKALPRRLRWPKLAPHFLPQVTTARPSTQSLSSLLRFPWFLGSKHIYGQNL